MKKGFTLVELIIVVVIIAIIAAIAVPIMQGIKARAIISEAVTGMSAIRLALREYYAQYGAYPPLPTNYISKIAAASFQQYFPSLSSADCATSASSGHNRLFLGL